MIFSNSEASGQKSQPQSNGNIRWEVQINAAPVSEDDVNQITTSRSAVMMGFFSTFFCGFIQHIGWHAGNFMPYVFVRAVAGEILV